MLCPPKAQIGIIKVNLSWFACKTNRNRKSALGANTTTKKAKKKQVLQLRNCTEFPQNVYILLDSCKCLCVSVCWCVICSMPANCGYFWGQFVMHLMGRHVPAPDDTPAGPHPNSPEFRALTFGLNSRARSEVGGRRVHKSWLTVRGIWLQSGPLRPPGHSQLKSFPWSIHRCPSGHGLLAQKST